MKPAQVTKPILDTSQALQFASEPIKNKNQEEGVGSDKIMPQDEINEVRQSRIFFAPKGDRRLTINIKENLHKQLKIAAIERKMTVGEIIEQLVERHL